MAKPEEERFSLVALNMADAIHYGISKLYKEKLTTINPDDFIFIKACIQTLDKDYLIQGFIEKSHIHWDKIKERNELFFIEHASSIFGFLPAPYLSMFTDLFTAVDSQGNTIVTKNLKDDIWRIFDAMVKISIKYTHKNRIIKGDSFLKEVNIEAHVITWDLTL